MQRRLLTARQIQGGRLARALPFNVSIERALFFSLCPTIFNSSREVPGQLTIATSDPATIVWMRPDC
jgi:hypothetical protein